MTDPPITAATLRRLYGEELTQAEIADRYDRAQSTVSAWFDELGVPTMPRGVTDRPTE